MVCACDSQKRDLSNITQFIKQANYFFGRLVNNKNIVLRVFKKDSLYTDVVLLNITFFRSFQKHRRARESKSEARERA